ncbi:uncharacterized protein LOC110920424 [Helianthus annuus]|uniref:uncharacterized protein LOC110920424 n=1 Tax=Helianthus annuus TaxID=4232 RepID=UPI000B8F41EF|nr:uncharacterized protein LOC110920424 [Helianthus annuus]
MNYLSLNIRGLGEEGKAGWVKDIIREHKINFMGLQETQFGSLIGVNWQSFWGNNNFHLEHVDAHGRSGGLVSLWDPSIFTKSGVLKGRHYLLVSGFIKGLSSEFHLMNVYAPHKTREKRVLWEDIKSIMDSKQGFWMLFGDFNSVRYEEDRKNSVFDPSDAQVFNDFIYSKGLMEFTMKGRKFTYCKGKGVKAKLRKIDRFLVSHNFVDAWSDACLVALPRFLSDHSPLVLAIDPLDFGPKPFRVFNSWGEKAGFDEAIKNAIDSFCFSGPADLYLANKLIHVKKALKVWVADVKLKKKKIGRISWWNSIVLMKQWSKESYQRKKYGRLKSVKLPLWRWIPRNLRTYGSFLELDGHPLVMTTPLSFMGLLRARK